MKRYFHVSVTDPSGKVLGPFGIAAAPDSAAGLTAAAVASAKALATAPEGSSLAYLQDLGPVDIE